MGPSALVVGGTSWLGDPLSALMFEAAAARVLARVRASGGVQGFEREPGPWPGLVARWTRHDDGWSAVIAHVVTDAEGDCRVVSAVLTAQRLRAASNP